MSGNNRPLSEGLNVYHIHRSEEGPRTVYVYAFVPEEYLPDPKRLVRVVGEILPNSGLWVFDMDLKSAFTCMFTLRPT